MTYRNVTKNGQEDVDEEVGVAAALEEDTKRRQDDGKKDLADIAGCERHDVCVWWLELMIWFVRVVTRIVVKSMESELLSDKQEQWQED